MLRVYCTARSWPLGPHEELRDEHFVQGTFVVLGAKGSTGRLIVAELLSRPAEVVVGSWRASATGCRALRSRTAIAPRGVKQRSLWPGRGCQRGDSLRMPCTVFFAAAGKGHETSKTVDRFGPGSWGRLSWTRYDRVSRGFD